MRTSGLFCTEATTFQNKYEYFKNNISAWSWKFTQRLNWWIKTNGMANIFLRSGKTWKELGIQIGNLSVVSNEEEGFEFELKITYFCFWVNVFSYVFKQKLPFFFENWIIDFYDLAFCSFERFTENEETAALHQKKEFMKVFNFLEEIICLGYSWLSLRHTNLFYSTQKKKSVFLENSKKVEKYSLRACCILYFVQNWLKKMKFTNAFIQKSSSREIIFTKIALMQIPRILHYYCHSFII